MHSPRVCILDVVSGAPIPLEPDFTHKFMVQHCCLANYDSCCFYIQHGVSVSLLV